MDPSDTTCTYQNILMSMYEFVHSIYVLMFTHMHMLMDLVRVGLGLGQPYSSIKTQQLSHASFNGSEIHSNEYYEPQRYIEMFESSDNDLATARGRFCSSPQFPGSHFQAGCQISIEYQNNIRL
jgi:hypothetical protein